MILSLIFKFDAAHRLMHYKGPCSHIHGHTWRVKVCIEGEVDSESGMVVDFSEIRKQIDNYVISFFDHAMIVNREDYDVKAFLKGKGFRYVEIDGEPTCENLAKLIYTQIEVAVPQKRLASVRVWETQNNSAIYTKE